MVFRLKVVVKDGVYLGKEKVQRVLEVPGSCTLEDLCTAILNAVDFDHDHLYEFTIGDRTYERYTESGKNQCRVKLYSLRLKKGSTFVLWYDFGDDWLFSIKVEDVLDGQGDGIRVLSGKGSVEQYPYDEEFDDEEYDDEEYDEYWEEEDESWNVDDKTVLDGIFAKHFDDIPDDDLDYDPDEDDSPLMMEDIEIDQDYDYTPPDALYEAAFRYKKTKLWKKLAGEEPFAIRFSDGTECIVSIMGMSGEHCAISVYPLETGYPSFYLISQSPTDPVWYLAKEKLLSQDCLQLILDNQDYLLDREIENARAYAEKNNIRFSGKNSFPHFSRFSPCKYPWHPKDEKEEGYLLEAAEAAIALSSLIGKKNPREFGFQKISPFLREIPLMTCEDGNWKISGTYPLPPVKEPSYIKPKPDAEKIARIKKIRAKGTLEARIIMFPSPVRGENGSAPYFPFVLLSIHKENDQVLYPGMVSNLTEEADSLADQLLDQLDSLKWKPSKIMVEDKRTLAFLSPIAEGLGVKLINAPSLELLDEVIDSFMRNTSGISDDFDDDMDYMDDEEESYDDMLLLLNMILDASDSAIRTMPRELREQIRMLVDANMLPPDMAAKLRKKLKLY